MRNIRFFLSIASAVLLFAGYLGSQWFYLQGRPSEWAAKMDQPPIRMLAAVILVLAFIFAFVPDREGGPSETGEG